MIYSEFWLAGQGSIHTTISCTTSCKQHFLACSGDVRLKLTQRRGMTGQTKILFVTVYLWISLNILKMLKSRNNNTILGIQSFEISHTSCKFLNWFSHPLTSYSSVLLILNNKLQEEDTALILLSHPYTVLFFAIMTCRLVRTGRTDT